MAPSRVPTVKASAPSHETVQERYLRPHHIPLLGLIFWIFNYERRLRLSTDYMLHVMRILLVEVSEASTPKSIQQLVQELEKGRIIDEISHELVLRTLNQLPIQLSTPHRLSEFFLDTVTIWSSGFEEEDMNDPEALLDKRSPFGLFCRRAFLTYRKMSFLALCTFAEDFQAWAKGDLSRGYKKIDLRNIRHDDFLIKTLRDKRPRADPEAYAEFERAKANGDKQAAGESLRRFFEQRFSEASDSDLRQHATLHHVRMHIATGHTAAARKLIQEAITVARTSGDATILQQCMALLRRIEGKTPSHKEPLNELQSDIPAMEIVNDVGKLVREGQPLSDCFEKMVHALGIYDLPKHTLYASSPEVEQWAFHAMQAVLWRLAGCEKLARIEENIVLAFTESGGSDDNRFTIIRNKAEALSRQGKEDEALSLLIDPETWRGLDQSLNQLAYWSGVVWITMLYFASRRGQHRQIQDFLKPRRPGTFTNWKDVQIMDITKGNVNSDIESQLYRVLQTRKVNQGTASIDHLLKALWQSEYQGRFHLYRLGTILLADAGLEFGMTIWSRKLIEDIMPQIIGGGDLELRAFACFVYARCIIACCGEDTSGLDAALPFLEIAEKDYNALTMFPAVQSVVYIRAIIHNRLGNMGARDSAAKEHSAIEQKQHDLEMVDVNESWDDIWSLLIEACVILSQRN